MTIASRNAGFQPGAYFEHGSNVLRVREAAGRIYSEDELWGNCPIINSILNPGYGIFLDEQFTEFDTTNDWTLTQATAGSGAVSVTIPGALTLNAGDTTTLHGVQIQRKVSAFIPAAGKDLWFEAVVQTAFLTGDFFIGLAAVDTTIIASSAMTTQNHLGWSSVTADGILLFDSDKAGTGTTATGSTLVAAANVALGFYYDGTADTVQQYVNGVAVGAAIATTYVSKSVMYPSFVCQNHGTDQNTMTISGYRVFQLR